MPTLRRTLGRDLSVSEAPLALVAHRVLGTRADTMLSIVALCATANTVLLLLLSASRSVYGMARAGMLPGAGALLCAWLLTHTGLAGLAIVGGLILVGLVLARRAGSGSHRP